MSIEPTSVKSLLERYEETLRNAPDRVAFVWVNRKGHDARTYTYAQFDLAAQAVAAYLFEKGVKRGDAVILAYGPGLDFFLAFWGCLMSGIVAVPVMPPLSNPDVDKFLHLYTHCEAKAILTDKTFYRLLTAKAYKQKAKQMARGVRALFGRSNTWKQGRTFADLMNETWLNTSGLSPLKQRAALQAQANDETAFIMYSSGSTSAPKGALTTFGNIDHQMEMNGRALESSSDHVSCWWAPHYHDYGLISGFLNVIYQGCRGVLASPFDFIQRPALWLDMIHAHQGTHTFGPDFGYQLLIKKTLSVERQNQKWNLSSLKVAMSAAEKVRASTIDAFSTAFATCGFRREAFCPAYGLAEHTVGVTINGVGKQPVVQRMLREPLEERGEALPETYDEDFDEHDDERVVELVGNGVARYETDLRIVRLDRDGHPQEVMPPGYVGEIWVSSRSATKGYFKAPELTEAAFHARLPNSPNIEKHYLRTGDLGFISAQNGELFICGRQKDMIILAGKNHYSEDFEVTLASHTSEYLRPGRIAAFSFEEPGTSLERLAVVGEVRHDDIDREAAFQAIQSCLAEEHKVAVSTIALIRARSIPKTSSGKLRRFEAREKLASNELQTIPNGVWTAPVAEVGPAAGFEDTVDTILRTLQAFTGESEGVARDTSLSALGLSSLELARLADAVNEQRPHAPIRVQDLLGLETVEEVARFLMESDASGRAQARQSMPPMAAHPMSQANEITKAVHPTLFAQDSLLKHHFLRMQTSSEWNIPLCSWLTGTVSVEHLRQAFEWLAIRQSALRTTFSLRRDGSFGQHVGEAWDPVNFSVEDVGDEETVFRRAREVAATALDVTETALKVHLLRLTPERSFMVVVIHHAICDGWSVGTLRDELIAMYATIEEGKGPEETSLKALPFQLVDVAHWQQGLLQNHRFDRRLGFWKDYLRSPIPHLRIPADRNPGSAVEGIVAQFELPEAVLHGLRGVSRRWSTSINVLFLTAYAAVLSRRYRQRELLIQLPVAGRPPGTEGIVGGFADSAVVRVRMPRRTAFQAMVESNHESFYKALEHQMPFGLISQSLEATAAERGRLSWVVLNVEQNVSHRSEGAIAMGKATLDAIPLPTSSTVAMPVYAHSVMDLNVSERGTLVGEWKCKGALMQQSELDGLAKRFVRMLKAVSRSSREGPALQDSMEMSAMPMPGAGFSSSNLFGDDEPVDEEPQRLSFPALVGDGSNLLSQEMQLPADLVGSSDLFGDDEDELVAPSASEKRKEAHRSSDLFGDDE